jgi:DNA-binding beta-propeller fold protein YncE
LLAGVFVVLIGGAYFALLSNSKRPEPGPNLLYDITSYADVDKVKTRFQEIAPIVPRVENPKALAVGTDGRLYVGGDNAVVVLGSDGAELSRFPIKGTPTCITAAPDGEVLVGLRTRIETFGSDGAAHAGLPDLGSRAYVSSIAANKDDVFVADAGNRVVLRFGRDGSAKGRIGEADPARDVPGLAVPSPYMDVAFDASGELWVVNPGRLGLESYRSNGDLITSWYRPSLKLDGFSGCCNPSHIAFRPDGKVVTCEKGFVRIKVYDVTSGEFEELVAGSSLFPREQAVRDLAVDARGRILVLDSQRNTIRVFEQKEGGHEQTHQPV